MTPDELRYAGLELALRRLWDEYERGLSRTWRGRLILRLSRLWARLACAWPRSAGPARPAHRG
ncbi:hypothetical protein ACIOC2_20325 [Streptomyces sp. NPDC088337]|uniref:hypothetical protein n=1 Tax=unclassified Streptomyces TaxID=2593676 RepID=UPI0033DF07C7